MRRISVRFRTSYGVTALQGPEIDRVTVLISNGQANDFRIEIRCARGHRP